jgi:hypothetical protein
VDCRKRIYERMRSLRLYRLEAGSMVRAELESYLSVLEPFRQQVGRVCADALISSCSRQRLEQFERMLGIPINPNIPLERRREIAASRMSIAPSDFNRSGLEKALDAAGIRAVVQDRPGTGTLVVQANEIADSNLSLDEAKQAFYSLMPAHLEAEFVTGGLDFSQFEQLGKSWAQLDAMDKSWSQLEMMGLQQWKEKEEEGQDVQQ